MRSRTRRRVSLGMTLIALAAAPAFAQTQPNAGKHDTAKGAAIGAAAGHEVGHGHALAGAAHRGGDRASRTEEGPTEQIGQRIRRRHRVLPSDGRQDRTALT